MVIGRARQHLEALNAQAADAVFRRHDAAIEGQLLAMLENLRLQVGEILFDVGVGLVLDLAIQLRGRDGDAQLLVLVLQRSRSWRSARADAESRRTCCNRPRTGPIHT